jgi:hypothetical protein
MTDRRRRNVRVIVTLLALAAVGLASPLSAQLLSDAPRAVVRVDDLVGIWTGQWLADGGGRGGELEVILARDPAERHAMVAQVTFVEGGQSDTVRREGRLTRAGAYFGLVGGGAMVLTLEPGGRLAGEFAGGPDVPVRRGSVDLIRMRKS